MQNNQESNHSAEVKMDNFARIRQFLSVDSAYEDHRNSVLNRIRSPPPAYQYQDPQITEMAPPVERRHPKPSMGVKRSQSKLIRQKTIDQKSFLSKKKQCDAKGVRFFTDSELSESSCSNLNNSNASSVFRSKERDSNPCSPLFSISSSSCSSTGVSECIGHFIQSEKDNDPGNCFLFTHANILF